MARSLVQQLRRWAIRRFANKAERLALRRADIEKKVAILEMAIVILEARRTVHHDMWLGARAVLDDAKSRDALKSRARRTEARAAMVLTMLDGQIEGKRVHIHVAKFELGMLSQ